MVRPEAQPNEEAEEPSGPSAAPRGPIMHVATKSMSVDDFVVRFSSLASEEALVLPSVRELPIGTEARFAVHLQDRSVVMRGRCRVTECRPGSSPTEGTQPGARRVMVRVALLEMDEESRAVHQRMLALKAAPVPAVEPAAVPIPIFGGDTERAVDTHVLEPLEALRPRRPRMPTPRLGSRSARPGPPPPPVEIRAPRASYTLPANPLGESELEDLSSMVEETLNEDPSGASPATSTREAEKIAPPDPDPPPRRGRAGARVLWACLACTATGIAVGWALRPAAPPPSPARAPMAATPPAPAKAPAPASALGGPIAPAPAPAKAALPPVPPPATAERPTIAGPPPRAVAVEPIPAAAPAGGGCLAKVVTEPADAKVFWGDTLLGRSPIGSAPVPCGPSRVTLERERYQTVAREVTAEPGAPFLLEERLARPPASVTIASSPPGAAIAVNGRPSGVTPGRLDLLRYERVTIKVTLAGHAPFERSVYLKSAETTIEATLTPDGAP